MPVHGVESNSDFGSLTLNYLCMASKDVIIAEMKQLVEKQATQILTLMMEVEQLKPSMVSVSRCKGEASRGSIGVGTIALSGDNVDRA